MAVLIPIDQKTYTVPHLKALDSGKYESREPSCGSTFNIGQGILTITNLLHKQGFVDSQLLRTVPIYIVIYEPMNELLLTR